MEDTNLHEEVYKIRALKAVDTKRKQLLDSYNDFEPEIQYFSKYQLYENAKKNYHIRQFIIGPVIKDINKPKEQELKIIAVDYLLHRGANLIEVSNKIYGKVGNSELMDRLIVKTLLLIRSNYPYLSKECNQQIKEISNLYHETNFYKPSNKYRLLSDLGCFNFEYKPESIRSITYKRSWQGLITKKHGEIVEALRNELLSKGKYPFNGINRDLFIKEGNVVTFAFEIKTEKITQDLVTGVGQLLWYYVNEKSTPKKIIVLPERLHPENEKSLKKLSIYPLYYVYKKGEPMFIDIDRILNSKG